MRLLAGCRPHSTSAGILTNGHQFGLFPNKQRLVIEKRNLFQFLTLLLRRNRELDEQYPAVFHQWEAAVRTVHHRPEAHGA